MATDAMSAETQSVRVVCPHCPATNRVPRARLADAPNCGACKRPLFNGQPIALSQSDLDRHISGSDLPIVVDFWAPWCAPCRAMAPVFERAARELEPHVRFVKINTDENPELATARGIRGIPTIAIFRDGAEVTRTSGAMDWTRFAAWVRLHT